MRHMKSILFSRWLICQNNLFSIDFLFLCCVNHDTQEWMNHKTQEWIARYVSFYMIQPGNFSDMYQSPNKVVLAQGLLPFFGLFSLLLQPKL